MKWILAFVSLTFAHALSAAPDYWPKQFQLSNETEQTMVVLYENGNAAYSSRTVKPGGAELVLAASKAHWEWCQLQETVSENYCLSLYIDELQSGQQDKFRIDYLYTPSTLAEIDKTGVQRVLKLRDHE